MGLLSTATLGWHLWVLEGTWSLLAVLVGMFAFAIQAVAYDGFKNRYLRLSGASVQEGEDLEEARAELADATSFVVVAALRAYVTFLRVQGVRPQPRETGDPARVVSLARASAWLGPSTHIFLLCAAALAGELFAYFVLRAVLSSLALGLITIAWRARTRVG